MEIPVQNCGENDCFDADRSKAIGSYNRRNCYREAIFFVSFVVEMTNNDSSKLSAQLCLKA